MHITDEKALKKHLDHLERELEENGNKLSSLSFSRYLDKQDRPEIKEIQLINSKILLDPELYQIVSHWHKQNISDPVLKRRVAVWYERLLLAQVDSDPAIIELEQKVAYTIMSFEYPVRDKKLSLGEVRAILRADPDKSHREAAWRSYQDLHRLVVEDMTRLFKLRNELAKKLGYDTFVDLRLEVNNQLTRAEVEQMLRDLTRDTDDVYKTILASGAKELGIETIEPWDIQYILEQMGGVEKSLFPKTGLHPSITDWANKMDTDLESLGIKSVFCDIPYNGLSMTLDRENVRILANPDDGYSYYNTHFHEMGHALHSALKTIDPFILRRESTIITEGIAEIFGYITHDPVWLKDFHGLPEEKVQAALKSSWCSKYHYIRQRTAYCLFEYAAYDNPMQDLDQLMAQVDADILHCSFNDMPRWAANGWYVSYPVYWQNYVLADFVASQIHHHLEENIGSLTTDKAAFNYVVKHYIEQGALIPWLDKIKIGTGEPLNAKAITEDLQSAINYL